MTYDKRGIMANAWRIYKNEKGTAIRFNRPMEITFGECLKTAWNIAKKKIAEAVKAAKAAAKRAAEAAKEAEEAARTGLRRMHYSEYKHNYSECQTVEGSYDKRTKTIEVLTKVLKIKKSAKSAFVSRANGLCPRCHTYCYGDCYFN